MINHARTLLLNQPVTARHASSFPGEVLVPEEFKPIEVPTSVDRFRRVVFGTAADRMMYNYRLWQLFTLLHATQLEEYVFRLDPRVTYWPPRRASSMLNAFFPAVDEPVRLQGDLDTASDGQLQHRFLVAYLGNDQVRVRRITPPLSDSVFTVAHDGNVTAALSLPGTSQKFLLMTTSIDLGRFYEITLRKRPSIELPACLASLETTITEEDTQDYLDTRMPEMRTFVNLYRDHKELPYRLGGLTLAVIYRMEHARLKGAA